MTELKVAVETFAADTDWPLNDAWPRVRKGQEKGLIGKGTKDGLLHTRAYHVTDNNLMVMLLLLASPVASKAADYVEEFKDLKAEDANTKKLVRLDDTLLDAIKLYGDDAWIAETSHFIDRVLLIYDEDWQRAEISYSPRGEDGEREPPDHILNFAPAGEGTPQLMGQTSKAVAINGGIFYTLADLLKDDVPA